MPQDLPRDLVRRRQLSVAIVAGVLALLCTGCGCRNSRGGPVDVGVVHLVANWPQSGVAVENRTHGCVAVRLRSTMNGRSANTSVTVPSGALRVLLPALSPGELDLRMVSSFPRSRNGGERAPRGSNQHIADYSLTIVADRDTFLLFRPMGSSAVTLLRYVTTGRSPVRRCTILGDDLSGISVVNDRRPPVAIETIRVACGEDELTMRDLPPNSRWFRGLPAGPASYAATAQISGMLLPQSLQ